MRMVGPSVQLLGLVSKTWVAAETHRVWEVRADRDTGVRLPDALIAATAVQLRMNLATRNDSDFKATEGLRIRKLA